MRNAGLDILRFLACFLVLFAHVDNPPDDAPALFRELCVTLRFGGWVGVDIFFVLSGFLVSGLLFKEHLRTGRLDVWRFLVRRGLKIYPAFWFFTLTGYFVMTWRHEKIPASAVMADLLFIQNYVWGTWSHTWSLAVEEHFYLGVALLFPILLRRSRSHDFSAIPRVFGMLALACLVLRLVTILLFPTHAARIHCFGSHIRFDSLFAGVLLSYLYHYRDLARRVERIRTAVLVAGGILLLLPAFTVSFGTSIWMHVAGFTLFYSGAALLVMAAVRLPSTSHAGGRLLVTLGRSSYAIYLWHVAVSRWLAEPLSALTGTKSYYLYFGAYLVGALATGWLMTILVEFPVLKLRDRYFPSRSAAPDTGAGKENPGETAEKHPTFGDRVPS